MASVPAGIGPAGRSLSPPGSSYEPASGRLEDRLEVVELASYAAADLVAKFEHTGVTDRVAGVVALLGAGDHAGGEEDPEVFGDVLL